MRRRQALNLSVPFVLNNPYRIGTPRSVSVATMEVGDGYICVEYQLGIEQVTTYVCKKDQIGSRYFILDEPVAEHLAKLKKQAIDHGATSEAIQFLGRVTTINKTEEATMAENKKLTTAGDKAGLKAAAKTTPVAGRKPPVAAAPEAKKKGNADALAAARAAKGPAPNRKYKVLTKEHGAREGTWTHHMATVIVKNKDTDSAKAAHEASGEHEGKKLDFKWAADKGLIEFA